MSRTRVRAALVTAAETFFAASTVGDVTDLPVLAPEFIAWENRIFKEAANPLWASMFYIPNVPTQYTVGKAGLDLLSGYIQLDFNVPLDSGEETLLAWEAKGGLFFDTTVPLVHEGQGVILTEAGMSAGRPVENHYRKSFTVAFRSYIKRVTSS